MTDPFFRDSCEDFKKADCQVGTTHIDPCSCYKFYKCNTGFTVINVRCANGTAYNHVSSHTVCDAEDDVILKNEICKVQAPWLRCNYTTNADQRYSDLAARCGQLSASPPIEQTGEGGSSSDTGAIVGAVLGTVIVLLIIGIVILLWRKKYFEKVQSRFSKKFTSGATRQSVQNPEYMMGGNIGEENYSTIDEVMHDPTYKIGNNTRTNDPSLPPRRFGVGRDSDSPSLNSHNMGRTDTDALYVEPNSGGPKVRAGLSFDNPGLQLDADDPQNPSYVIMSDTGEQQSADDDVRKPTPYDNSWNGT